MDDVEPIEGPGGWYFELQKRHLSTFVKNKEVNKDGI